MFDVIFEPFRQQDESISKHYSGTGLGLTITKRLTKMMNGEIFLNSKVDFGSTFTLKLYKVGYSNSFEFAILKENSTFNFEYLKLNVLIYGKISNNSQKLMDFFSRKKIKFDFHQLDKNFDYNENNYNLIIYDCYDNYQSFDKFFNEVNKFADLKKSRLMVILENSQKCIDDIEQIKDFADAVINFDFSLNEFNHYLEKILIQNQNKKSQFEKGNQYNFSETQLDKAVCSIICKNLKPEWDVVKKGNILDEINKFALNNINAGKLYSSQILVDYGNNLKESVDSFDIEAMVRILADFQQLIDSAYIILNK